MVVALCMRNVALHRKAGRTTHRVSAVNSDMTPCAAAQSAGAVRARPAGPRDLPPPVSRRACRHTRTRGRRPHRRDRGGEDRRERSGVVGRGDWTCDGGFGGGGVRGPRDRTCPDGRAHPSQAARCCRQWHAGLRGPPCGREDTLGWKALFARPSTHVHTIHGTHAYVCGLPYGHTCLGSTCTCALEGPSPHSPDRPRATARSWARNRRPGPRLARHSAAAPPRVPPIAGRGPSAG